MTDPTPPEEEQPTERTALTDPDAVQFEVVPDDELPGTGLSPEEAWAVLEADPSTYGPQEE
jgi:hypothetical protein